MQFEEDVNFICSDSWRKCPQDEREGAFGVAMVRAFLEGVRPSFEELANVCEINDDDVFEAETAYRRLVVSGIFTPRYNARKDRALQGWSSKAEGRNAWGHIAGIGSGWIGAGYYIQRVKENKQNA